MKALRKHLPHLSVSLLLYWGLLLGALWVFGELAGEVYEHEGFFFDAPILGWLAAHQVSWAVKASQILYIWGSPQALGVMTAVLMLIFWLRLRNPRAALFLALSLGGAMLLNILFKLFFARARPTLSEQLTPAPGYSFPSGHAMGSMAFFLALYLLVARLAPRWRTLAGVLAALFTLCIGVSRLVLQVHYPSDVLAGWALSAAWVLGVNLIYTWALHQLQKRREALLR